MRKRVSLIAWAAAIMLMVAPLRAAQEASTDAVFKAKGLTRSGLFYLLDGDLNLRAGLRTMRQTRSQLDGALARRAEIEHQLRTAREAQTQLYAQGQALGGQMEKAKNLPLRYNDLLNQATIVQGKIREVEQYIEGREKALKAFSIPSEDYIVAANAQADRMEATQKQYDALAADPDITSALAQMNAGQKIPLKLGPSVQFTTELQSVRQEREKIRSAAVKFEMEGGVPVISVMLNGTLPWKMVIDSGAAEVTLTYSVARQLGLNLAASDPVMRLQTADGKVTEARLKTLKSIRLAQFEVSDVECAVLPEGVEGDNLLGGTFLSRFVYRMDLNAGELHLSQIGPTPKPASANKHETARTPEASQFYVPKSTLPAAGTRGQKPPTAQQTTVRAADAWVATTFRVDQGRCYRLTATGLWKDSRGRECGPEGSCPKAYFALLGPQTELTKEQQAEFYVGQHPRGAMICRIGQEKWDFYVGAECRFVAPTSGFLSFRMNDDDRSTVAQPGECAVTFVRSDPDWVHSDGTVEIAARIDVSDSLHLTRAGPYWEWDGQWGKVGLNAGVYPTVINGVYWWPNWVNKTTTDRLPVPALWPGDPSHIELVETKAKRGVVQVASSTPDELVLLFEKRPRGAGSTQISVVLRFK